MRAAWLGAVVSFAAAAHAPVPLRALRLQLRGGHLEGLLTFHLPAAATQVYAAARDPSPAVAARALEGLRIEADGSTLDPKAAEAHAQWLADGGLDERVLLDVGPARKTLTIAVEAEPPLPVELVAASGVRLQLASGPGAPIAGGLSLRRRPGLPCVVAITSAAATNTRR